MEIWVYELDVNKIKNQHKCKQKFTFPPKRQYIYSKDGIYIYLELDQGPVS